MPNVRGNKIAGRCECGKRCKSDSPMCATCKKKRGFYYRRNSHNMNDKPEHWADLDVEEMEIAKAAIKVVRNRTSKDRFRSRIVGHDDEGIIESEFRFRSDCFEDEYNRAFAKLRSKNDYRKNAAKTKSCKK